MSLLQSCINSNYKSSFLKILKDFEFPSVEQYLQTRACNIYVPVSLWNSTEIIPR